MLLTNIYSPRLIKSTYKCDLNISVNHIQDTKTKKKIKIKITGKRFRTKNLFILFLFWNFKWYILYNLLTYVIHCISKINTKRKILYLWYKIKMSTLKIRLTTIYITQFYILKLSFIFIFYKMINKIFYVTKKKKVRIS